MRNKFFLTAIVAVIFLLFGLAHSFGNPIGSPVTDLFLVNPEGGFYRHTFKTDRSKILIFSKSSIERDAENRRAGSYGGYFDFKEMVGIDVETRISAAYGIDQAPFLLFCSPSGEPTGHMGAIDEETLDSFIRDQFLPSL
jgi:hypothetical protein